MPLPKLGVNIDHVATIRQARRTYEPDPVTAAALATLGGAEIITCHLREDRRHLQDRDLHLLRQTVFSKLNLEMAITKKIVNLACKLKPEQVTLVPEKRTEVTTEGGLNVIRGGGKLQAATRRIKKRGIIVSFFVDAEPGQLRASADMGADAVELHTGAYANARTERTMRRQFNTLVRESDLARSLGLRVNAGHGLTYINVRGIVENLEVEELHIGHSIMARAIFVGMERAVKEMCDLIARYS